MEEPPPMTPLMLIDLEHEVHVPLPLCQPFLSLGALLVHVLEDAEHRARRAPDDGLFRLYVPLFLSSIIFAGEVPARDQVHGLSRLQA